MTQTNVVRGRSTNVTIHKGELIVTYHRTNVVIADLTSHVITLNSGGWETATTKLRMNQASNQYDLGYAVYQRDYEWFVVGEANQPVPFYDHMRFVVIDGEIMAIGD